MVLVVLFPLPDEKNVDVKTIFTCSQTCLLEMKLRVLSMHPLETRIAPRQASALNNEKHCPGFKPGGARGWREIAFFRFFSLPAPAATDPPANFIHTLTNHSQGPGSNAWHSMSQYMSQYKASNHNPVLFLRVYTLRPRGPISPRPAHMIAC